MNAQPSRLRPVLFGPMTKAPDQARAFLRLALEKTGWSPYRLATEAGVAPTTITRPLNDPDFKFTPKQATLFKIAAAAKLDPPTLAALPNEPEEITRFVPLIGEVRAGAWSEIPDEPAVEDMLAISLPEYERASVYALRVVGRSMDLIYSDGTIVIVIPTIEAGVREGDHVVVRRHRSGLTETTLKEVVRTPDGELILQPRSTDPTHQQPIRLTAADGSCEGVELFGVVVASYQTTRRGRGPLVDLG